ncbi:MAG: hypothetical protein A2W23_00430 [Planctomycetes bacterium RBG_16_43_13]|nr:MAG: hypothetical protein A2W23_00430 [Planctomycetes bacterium RBG_16_43_13]
MNSDIILKAVDKNREWAISKLNEYLKIPSVSAQNSGIKESVAFLQRTFTEIGLDVKICEAGGSPVVFASKNVGGNKTILFYNHYDVQPPEPLDEWLSPPFEPTIRDGKIFARGVSDNKANLITRIAAVKTFKDVNTNPSVNIKFVVEGEEEVGSEHLPNFTMQYRNLLDTDLCIWESASKDEVGRPQIILGCKGMVHGELVAKGANTDLHSSRAVIIPNPAWRVVWALATIKDKNENILIKGFYDDAVIPDENEKKLLEEIPFEEDKLRKNLGLSSFVNNLSGFDLKHRFFYSPTFTINGFTGGYQGKGSKTVLPKIATAKFDIRLVPNMQPDDIVKKLRKHLDENGFADIEIADVKGYPPARTPYNNPYVRIIAETGKEVWQKEMVVYPSTPASGPMYLFSKIAPCIGLGVGHAQSNSHAPNESVYIEDFYIGTKHIANILAKMGG